MCNIQAVLRPDAQLTKMMTFVKIILIINILSCFLRIFLKPSDMIYDLFCALFLFLAYNSVYFIYMAMYIILALFNSILLFVTSATIFQMLLQNTLGDMKKSVPAILGISLYLLIFYVFAIVFTYPVYREMKAQLMENNGGGEVGSQPRAGREANGDVERNEPSRVQSSGFQAFTGRGVPVGGTGNTGDTGF